MPTYFPPLFLACSVAITGLVGCRGKADTEGPTTQKTPVTVARVVVLPIVEWDEYIGRLDAIETVEIRARVSGFLQSIHFDEGILVQKGDLLAVVDPRPYEAELAAATARLQEADARLEESRAMKRQAEAQKKQNDARIILAENNLARAQSLAGSNAISQEDVDIRRSETAQALADGEAATAAIASAEAGIATAQAAMRTAQSLVDAAELSLSYTRVTSPIDGRISFRYVTQGNLISGGSNESTLLTTIVSIDPIHCYFDADEQAFLKYTRLAQSGKRESSRDVKNPVYLSLIDEQGYPHVGHMDFVDNRIDPNTGTMRGRAIFPNNDGVLVPGLFATVRLPGSGRYEAILIPDSAIASDQADKFVYVVGEGENGQPTVRRQRIVPGPMIRGLRVVREGLKGDERILTRGLQRLFPGAAIEPTEESIELGPSDGLPDDYEPVPREKWLGETGRDTREPLADSATSDGAAS